MRALVSTTTMRDDYSDPKAAALALAGNWLTFESFAWWGRDDEKIPDSERWAILYTSNRDSTLLDQSNAATIDTALHASPDYEANVSSESHKHWAVGHVDGYAIRCLGDDGEPTPAWRVYCELQASLADYPILNEEDYSEREYNATIENIRDAGRRLVKNDAPEGWESDAYQWFSDNEQGAIENRDDIGGYPSDDEMRECLAALNLLDSEA